MQLRLARNAAPQRRHSNGFLWQPLCVRRWICSARYVFRSSPQNRHTVSAPVQPVSASWVEVVPAVVMAAAMFAVVVEVTYLMFFSMSFLEVFACFFLRWRSQLALTVNG